jgi:divalent metal cation (Fe/Co/Zn/Cd) transporter
MGGETRVQGVLVSQGLADIAVLVAKATVDLSTGSEAILSDSIDSLADLLDNVAA